MRLPIAFSIGTLVWCASKPEFEVRILADQMVGLRDRVKLATDIYLPVKDAPSPVLLYRTPYNKDGQRNAGNWFAARGYAVVAQDVRGRFKSQGDFYPFVNEGKDGYDTIEWAAGQHWSNGKVGTIGASYLAWDQYHAAMYKPPHLVAMYADVGGNNFYDEFGYPGGAPNLGWTVWMLGSAMSSGITPVDELRAVQKDINAWFAQPPSERVKIFERFPAHKKLFEDFYSHPRFDDYWKQKGFFTQGGWKQVKDVPIFFVSGWYDYFVEGLIENFTGLARIQKTPKRMWLGPWPHSVGRAECGQANFGSSAAFDMREVALDWFDFWMRSDPLEVLGQDRVRYFRMGGGSAERDASGRVAHGGSWQNSTFWPPRGLKWWKYYLQGEGGLSAYRPEAKAPSTYEYDPKNPAPSIGGRYTMVPTIAACAQDQSKLRGRPDVLTFETEPLPEAVGVTGRVTAKLWVSSTAASADFTAKITDVYPDGFALILGDGIRRVAIESGKSTRIEVDLGTISNLFAKGHRIRLDVSSSNYPRAEPNANAGSQSIFHDPLRPSLVELPIQK